MTDESPTSETPQSSVDAKVEKPPRNPIERLIVWGGILVLLGVAGSEAFARFGYNNSVTKIGAAIAADDAGEVLYVKEVPALLSGNPAIVDDKDQQLLTYTWSGPLKTYGSVLLKYNQEGEVLDFSTADAPEPEPIVYDDDVIAADMEDAGMAMGGGPGPGAGDGGGRGSGRGFDPMQFDTDGDGKISLDEAPERMQENFAEIDSNSDGFADAAEFEARRAAFRGGAGRGGPGGESSGRPQRPDIEETAPPNPEQAAEASTSAETPEPAAEDAPKSDDELDE